MLHVRQEFSSRCFDGRGWKIAFLEAQRVGLYFVGVKSPQNLLMAEPRLGTAPRTLRQTVQSRRFRL